MTKIYSKEAKIYKSGRNIVMETEDVIIKHTVNPGINYLGSEEDWEKIPENFEFKDQSSITGNVIVDFKK